MKRIINAILVLPVMLLAVSCDYFYTMEFIAVRRNFYHKVSCLFESSSGTLTGSSGLL